MPQSSLEKRGDAIRLRLWRDNRIANEWSISEDELVTRFQAWPRRAETIVWRGIEFSLRLFITELESKGGLNSVFDEPEFQTFVNRKWRELTEANRNVDREFEELGR